jgi:cytoskeletal protein CcmA (bactofilin family)
LETTFLNVDSIVKGELNFNSPANISGKFEGNIKSDSSIVFPKSSRIRAFVTAPRIVVEGYFRGECHANESVTIKSGAVFLGKVASANLMIEDGASFQGELICNKH